MTLNYEVHTASEALPVILKDLLEYGEEVGSRNGRARELLNTQIVLTDPVRREVLSLNRKVNIFAQIAETLWVISGRNDIEWLSAYLPRATDYSDDGETWRAGYGPRIRAWGEGTVLQDYGHTIDQLRYVVDLLQRDPMTRQAVIGIWDPAVDTTPGKDKACNTFLQFQSRLGELHLTVTVRSNDVMWGWSGINAFEWSTLQEMVASILGIRVGTLVFNIGSLHLYQQHWQKASTIEEDSVAIPLRPIRFNEHGHINSVFALDQVIDDWFTWEAMCREGKATEQILDAEFSSDPMIKAWARMIAYYWQREDHWLTPLSGTALAVAAARTPVSVLPEPRVASTSTGAGHGHNMALHERTRAFYEYATSLHSIKHASYGNSWKKRGEQMSILANMARKVDRLGIGDQFDSSSDTVVDLLIYAIKYHCWLEGEDDGPAGVDQRLGQALSHVEDHDTKGQALDITFLDILHIFDNYADRVQEMSHKDKEEFVTDMILTLAPIARDLWFHEQTPAAEDDYLGADHD